MVIRLGLWFGYTMGVRFTTGELAAILEGDHGGVDSTVAGVSIDSRSVNPGQLFVALIAERDGHDFIETALKGGASAYLHSRPGNWGGAGVLVADTKVALAALGAASRKRLMASTVIGVTGSVGKTSVKDLIAAACSGVRKTHANIASFNNELGLPITLVNAPADTEVAVLEMGARGIGHVSELCKIARPNVGLITKIAAAHTELFGSLDQVAQAKGELIECLPVDGTAVLNADDDFAMRSATRTRAQVLTFGVDRGEVRATNIVVGSDLRPRFTLDTPDGKYDVELMAAGGHMAGNAAAAVAAAMAAGVSVPDAIEGISKAEVSPLRMQVQHTPSGAVVINDAYNANPTSMRAALNALGSTGARRKVAVLGLMAELGDRAEKEHKAIAREAALAGIEVVAIDCKAYGNGVLHVPSINDAAAALGSLTEGDAVLVKASRVAELERFAAMLIAGTSANG
jgi:UDP-N-acetylmuramoyl-tripeptide--D-alanyl-D-alanine ligase